MTRDPRLTPARPDLAARHLQGDVEAERFADGVTMRVIAPVAGIWREPDMSTSLVTELLFGETFTAYEQRADGWVWGQCDHDGYIGWTRARRLSPGPRSAAEMRRADKILSDTWNRIRAGRVEPRIQRGAVSMAHFHDLLFAVHGEIWEGGTEARPELDAMLRGLGAARLPKGVRRLPSAAMVAGPHLAAQDEADDASERVIWLDAGRIARSRARRFAGL